MILYMLKQLNDTSRYTYNINWNKYSDIFRV